MKLIITKTKEEAVKKAASIIYKLIKRKPNAVLGLATGKTMIPLYHELAGLYKKGKLDFSKIKTFNLDEYAESSLFHHYMEKHLFSKINISSQNIHFPTANGKAYEKEIKKAEGIDLCILGIGKNAHVAFNEPGSSFNSFTRTVRVGTSKKKAYSMGIKTIMNSKKILLLAFGTEKAAAIEKSVRGKITEKVPASILRKHRNSIFIIDRKAASKL